MNKSIQLDFSGQDVFRLNNILICYAKNFTFEQKRQMRQNFYSGIVNLIDPGEINKNFEIVTINKKRESITILFKEKSNLIPQRLKEKDAVLDGFLNPVDLQTFPLKDKTVYYA